MCLINIVYVMILICNNINWFVFCRYRRFFDYYEFVEDFFCYLDDVEDIDILFYDECIFVWYLGGWNYVYLFSLM